METTTYMAGRRSQDGAPVGEAHAVIAEAAAGEGPFTAECGAEVETIDGRFPPEASGPGTCPACTRVTGLAI